jgi:hypothetical protein
MTGPQKRPLYQAMASKLEAIANCRKNGNAEWQVKHGDALRRLVRNHMPSGGGFDAGTTLDLEASHADRLVFDTECHHMNADGMYTRWTMHIVIVRPSLVHGFTVHVSGPNHNSIRDYIADVFRDTLSEMVRE